MPSIIQYALIFESLANVYGGTVALLAPKWCIAGMLGPREAANPSPSTLTLVQGFGAMVYALTVPLILSLPDGPQAKAVRAITYYTLGAGELFLIPLLLVKAKQDPASGFKSDVLMKAVGSLAPFAAWRAYVLWLSPTILEPKSAAQRKQA